MSFLFAWQRIAGDDRASGPESLAGLIEQLEGFPAQAAAWESEILPARLNDYDPGVARRAVSRRSPRLGAYAAATPEGAAQR